VVELPDPDEPDPVAPLEAPLLGEALGEAVVLPDDIPDEPLEPESDDELCAIATLDRARSAAAVALVTSFNIDQFSLRKGEGNAPGAPQALCRRKHRARRRLHAPASDRN
jgi:hypothetical protein